MHTIRTSGFGVSNRIMSGKINGDTIISGSSRALAHYHSGIISEMTGYSTFNIGRNGSQTDMQLAFLKAYLNHNAKPKLVIHNLDLFTLQTSKEVYDPGQYLPYLDQAPIYEALREIYPQAWKWKLLPLYGYVAEDMRFSWLLGLRALTGLQPREDRVGGFEPRYTDWTGDFEAYREAYPKGVHTAVEAGGLRALEDLIVLCRSRHIDLLLVYSPEYREMQALEINRAEIFAEFEGLCSRYNIPLWDYSDSPISLSRSNFYNSQHLNAKGAEEFSTHLGGRLREMILRKQASPPSEGTSIHPAGILSPRTIPQ